jgi:hypothetical protein
MVVEEALQYHTGKVTAAQADCVMSPHFRLFYMVHAALGPVTAPDKVTD